MAARDIDRLSDKSQLVVILTSEGQMQLMRERVEKVAEADEKRASQAKAAEEKKDRQRRTRAVAKPAGSSKKRKNLHAETHKRAFRKACSQAAAVPGDTECITCPALWSMFESHAEDYAGEMRECAICSGWQCVMCAPGDEAFAKGHEYSCRANSLKMSLQAMLMQQHAVAQKARHAQDDEDEDEAKDEDEDEDQDQDEDEDEAQDDH